MPSILSAYYGLSDLAVVAMNGEPCSFVPKIGDSKAVSAAVDQSSGTVDDERGIYSEERLEVLVSRSASTGIATVAIGDGFRRDTDPVGVLYAYTGEKIDVSDSAWKLAFVLRRPFQRGGNTIK